MWKRFKKKTYRCIDCFQNFRVIVAIRKGFIMTIPLILIGALSKVIVNFPSDVYKEWINNVCNGGILKMFSLCDQATFGFMSMWLVIAISFAYIGICDEKLDNMFALPLISIVAYLAMLDISRADFNISEISTEGMFIALVSVVISCELYLAIMRLNVLQKRINTTGIDTVLAGAIRAVIPAAIIIGIAVLFRQIIDTIYGNVSIQKLFTEVCTGMFSVDGHGYLTTLQYLFLSHFFWIFGIHGNNVLATVGERLLVQNAQKAKIVADGVASSDILNDTLISCFVYLGGTGAILCLVLGVMFFIKKKSVRSVCKLGLIPSLFNISEIVTFGLPVVLNPILAVPFIIAPIVNFSITYYSMYMGWVPVASNPIDWTTPIIVSGYQATGSVNGAILQAILLVVGILIYYPFLKMHANSIERKFINGVNELKNELMTFETINKVSNFLERNDRIGDVAKILAGDLKYDIEHKKLFMAYQPQVNDKGEYIGAEALIRWHHSSVGFVYPPLIIALAKEAKMLDKLEKVIISEVCKSVKYIQDNYDEEYKISANITAESLRYHKFEYMVDKEVDRIGIDRTKLWFEITEQEAVMSNEELIDKLTRLRKQGHRLLIDDFGMGHTSVLYLQTNLFDYVKLDGSITRNVLSNTRNQEIISSIVDLSKKLDFKIISEYVETEEQKNKLYELGCFIYQGYLYSKPVRFNEFISQLDENREAFGKKKKKLN